MNSEKEKKIREGYLEEEEIMKEVENKKNRKGRKKRKREVGGKRTNWEEIEKEMRKVCE